MELILAMCIFFNTDKEVEWLKNEFCDTFDAKQNYLAVSDCNEKKQSICEKDGNYL